MAGARNAGLLPAAAAWPPETAAASAAATAACSGLRCPPAGAFRLGPDPAAARAPGRGLAGTAETGGEDCEEDGDEAGAEDDGRGRTSTGRAGAGASSGRPQPRVLTKAPSADCMAMVSSTPPTCSFDDSLSSTATFLLKRFPSSIDPLVDPRSK